MLRSRLLACALLLVAPGLIGGADLTSNLEERLLAAHNRERSAMGIAPLAWNARLQASAQSWAEHLAATGTFAHAPERRGDPQGENIWGGSHGHYPAEAMIEAWVREKRYFKPGRFPDNSTTGKVADVGHYTQLMWRGTGQVGCALAAGESEDILVCRYSDAGNYVGETPF